MHRPIKLASSVEKPLTIAFKSNTSIVSSRMGLTTGMHSGVVPGPLWDAGGTILTIVATDRRELPVTPV